MKGALLMRFQPPARLLAALLVLTSPALIAARDQATHGQHPGAAVMGFDQDKTTHRFRLFEDGGAIEVSVKDAADAKNRDAIRAHLPQIAMMFGHGNFNAPMLVHGTTTVPGTAVMAERKTAIIYKYVETKAGGRVDITTTDKAALAGVHDFLRFQISDHKTGDSTAIVKR